MENAVVVHTPVRKWMPSRTARHGRDQTTGLRSLRHNHPEKCFLLFFELFNISLAGLLSGFARPNSEQNQSQELTDSYFRDEFALRGRIT
jgi:hypothetical protein